MSNIKKPIRDEGSFRDPSGYVFIQDKEVYRTINTIAEENFNQILKTGAIQEMVKNDLLIATEIIREKNDELYLFEGARGEIPKILVKHPKIQFISYAYEWTFSQLKDAALAHLDMQINCLEYGVTLSDASTFNMQIHEGKFKHIDILSMRAYKDGEPWKGYNQFCRMFLAPLLVEAWTGIPFQSLLRGKLDGLDLNEINRILPKSKLWLSLNGLLHISLQASLISKINSSKKNSLGNSNIFLPQHRFKALLKELRGWINNLKSGRRTKSYWSDYAHDNTYSNEMSNIKKEFITNWVKQIPQGIVWDIGGNTGEYSKAALSGGASLCIVFDGDIDSIEKAYSETKKGLRILPLVMDLADPSPCQGWKQKERYGLSERSRPDGLMALAVIHHLAIGRNLPLKEVVKTLVDFAPNGIMEFVPKSDPMVINMLSNREDVFPDYTEANFMNYLQENASITGQHRFIHNDRLLVSYSRNI